MIKKLIVKNKSLDRQGQSAVGFSLVVSMAILMFLGMVQFGMYLYRLSIFENEARHAARIGSGSQATPLATRTQPQTLHWLASLSYVMGK